MPSPVTKFRVGLVLGLLVCAGAAVAAVRWAVLPWALGAALRAGGAANVSFDVTRASPWQLQVDDLAFDLEAARVAARRTTLERTHWWSPSLGRLRVEAARVDVDLGRLTSGPPAGPAVAGTSAPVAVPLEEVSVDGRLTVRVDDDAAQALDVRFAARPARDAGWTGSVQVGAPGLEVAVEATYAPSRQEAIFRTTALRLEIGSWQGWMERWAPLPSGPWEITGKVGGTLAGSYREGAFSATGDLHLREGRVANSGLGLVAEGVEADVGTVDLAALEARDVVTRVQSVNMGKVQLTGVAAQLASATAERVEVSALSAKALGGAVHVEPFVYRPADPAVEVVVRAEEIRAEQVMALTDDLPARATGPLSGRLPLRYEAGALRLGTGWLGLAAGGSLELQFHAEGLLTAGTSPQSANYAVLKQVEDGLLKLKVTELRLDVRPPGAPASRTAQLHLAGAPVDPRVKAPVTLDLNVNGPIESLLNLGLKTGAGAGTKP